MCSGQTLSRGPEEQKLSALSSPHAPSSGADVVVRPELFPPWTINPAAKSEENTPGRWKVILTFHPDVD